MEEVGILIIDDDEVSQAALRQILDSDGWRVRVAPLVSQGLAELSSGTWTLAIVNVALTDLDGPAFATFKELGQSDVAAPSRKRLRVLFLVPTLVASQAQPLLERERLPYVLKPFHLHDFLEKISDLLLEAQAILKPIRQMQAEPLASERRQKERRSGKDSRGSAMFASRADYQMTEEEIAEYEKQEEEERKKKSKRGKEPGRP